MGLYEMHMRPVEATLTLAPVQLVLHAQNLHGRGPLDTAGMLSLFLCASIGRQ